MLWLMIKYLVTAAMIVAVSEVSKHNDRLGVLLIRPLDVSNLPTFTASTDSSALWNTTTTCHYLIVFGLYLPVQRDAR